MWGGKNERRLARSCLGNGERALVSPAGANRDNEGVLRGSGGGAVTRPLPLPASFASVFPVCSSFSFA